MRKTNTMKTSDVPSIILCVLAIMHAILFAVMSMLCFVEGRWFAGIVTAIAAGILQSIAEKVLPDGSA